MSDTCICGHERDEHATAFFSACEVCPCIAFEADPDDDEIWDAR